MVNHNEEWQQKIQQLSGVVINEFHMRDIANIEHPCAFDTLEEYDLLILESSLHLMMKLKWGIP